MSDLTNAGETIAADATFGAGDYLALLTAITDVEAGTVTEASGGSYARQAITWTAASNGLKSNSADISFTGTTGTIVGVGVYSASSGGTLKAVKSITSTALISTDTFTFSTGNLSVQFA